MLGQIPYPAGFLSSQAGIIQIAIPKKKPESPSMSEDGSVIKYNGLSHRTRTIETEIVNSCTAEMTEDNFL